MKNKMVLIGLVIVAALVLLFLYSGSFTGVQITQPTTASSVSTQTTTPTSKIPSDLSSDGNLSEALNELDQLK